MKKIILLLLASTALASADTITEDFTSDPAGDGWQTFGDSSLFAWDSTNHDLAVTWDSSFTNSYYFHSLPMTLTRQDDFSLAFDIDIKDVASGTTPGKPSIFELAVGFVNLTSAIDPGFLRGTGFTSPNLVEFDYFPDFIDTDSGMNFGDTVGPTIFSSDNIVVFAGDTANVGLQTNVAYHVQMNYTALNQTLVTLMTNLDTHQAFGPIHSATLGSSFSDFALDTIAVCSYSDFGQDPEFPEGSIRAHGTVSNFVFVQPPIAGIKGAFNGPVWEVQFRTLDASWQYTLLRATDLQSSFTPVDGLFRGTQGTLTLQDTNPPAGNAFYRVSAEQVFVGARPAVSTQHEKRGSTK